MSRKDNKSIIHTFIGPWCIYLLSRAILSTCRISLDNASFFVSHTSAGKNLILVSWHDTLVTLPYYYRYKYDLHNLTIMVSLSREGEMFDRLLAKYDVKTVRGSTTRGGRAALKSLIRIVRQGRDTSMALDGSKGPWHIVQSGALLMAQMTGTPLVPIVVSIKNKFHLPTWDKMQIPLPFSRIHVAFGEPMYIPRETKDLEPYRFQLQETMDSILTKADQHLKVK